VKAADVLVVGAGPAGATAALNLAPLHHVLLVERRPATRVRIGESLPPAAQSLLSAMGLWGAFVAEGHDPCHVTRAVWGSREPNEKDFLRDPNGPGWQLDRARFDRWLRREAVERGTTLMCPARLRSIARERNGWRVTVETASGAIERRVRTLIDASGRSAAPARRLGARRFVDDRLVCGWLHGRDAGAPAVGVTYVVAEPDGWWYAAPLPGGRRVLAFFTDADLPAARDARNPDALLARAQRFADLAGAVPTIRFTARPTAGFTAGHGATLAPSAGDGWAAAGDAALAFDPLSAQGLLNSLFTGLAAAQALDRTIAGDPTGLPEYTATLRGIRDAYRRHITSCYADERRWAERPFWQRRQMPGRHRVDRPHRE
jgi:flavin-dependent dehydrogenase